MSLKLKKVNTVKTRVHTKRATSDADRTQDVSFGAEFKYLGRRDFDALMDREPSDAEFLEEVLVGLTEITDESGAPVSFEVAREAVIDDLGLAAATVRAYVAALGAAEEKNAHRSRAR